MDGYPISTVLLILCSIGFPCLAEHDELVATEVDPILPHNFLEAKAVYSDTQDAIYIFTETLSRNGWWYIHRNSLADGAVTTLHERRGIAGRLCIVQDGVGSILIFGYFGDPYTAYYKFNPKPNILKRVPALLPIANMHYDSSCAMVTQDLVVTISRSLRDIDRQWHGTRLQNPIYEAMAFNLTSQEHRNLTTLRLKPIPTSFTLKAANGVNHGEVSLWYKPFVGVGGYLHHAVYNYEDGSISPDLGNRVRPVGFLTDYLNVGGNMWLPDDGTVGDGNGTMTFLQVTPDLSEFKLWKVRNMKGCKGCVYAYAKAWNKIYIFSSVNETWYISLEGFLK